MIPIGNRMPAFAAKDEIGNSVTVPHPNEYVYLMFNPPTGGSQCKSCSGSYLHDVYPSFRIEGCQVYGATFDGPESNKRRNSKYIWRIPFLQVSHQLAAAWHALRPPDDPWSRYIPKSVAYLVHPSGQIMGAYESGLSVHSSVKALEDLQKLNAMSMA